MSEQNITNEPFNEAELHLIAVGKAIEARGITVATTIDGKIEPNLELSSAFAAAKTRNREKAQVETQEQESKGFLSKLFGVAKSFFLGSEDKNNSKQASSSFGGLGSVDALTAELEREVSQLRSIPRDGSAQNDLAMLQKMSSVMAKASELERTQGARVQPSPQVEQALITVSNISLVDKRSASGNIAGELQAAQLHVAEQSIGASTQQHQGQSANEMINSLQGSAGTNIHPSAVPTTAAAQAEKDKRNKAFAASTTPVGTASSE